MELENIKLVCKKRPKSYGEFIKNKHYRLIMIINNLAWVVDDEKKEWCFSMKDSDSDSPFALYQEKLEDYFCYLNEYRKAKLEKLCKHER